MLNLLIAAGADPARQDTSFHMTALHFTAASNRTAIAEVLLAAGDDVNILDGNGNTALLHAASDGHLEMAELLIAHGANVSIANEDGDTPYRVAKGNSKMLELLSKAGATE